jgi:hypothetical protein
MRGESGYAVRGKGSPPLCGVRQRREATGSAQCAGAARAVCRRAGVLCGGSSARGAGQDQSGADATAGSRGLRLRGSAANPLTLLTQRTRAAVAKAGRIHDTHTPIGLSASRLRSKRLPCWTPERPIGLERKVGSGEATRFEGGGSGRWAIPGCGSGRGGAASAGGALRWKLMCLEVLGDGLKALAQFLPVAPVPSVAKRAESLVAVSLADVCAGAHHLPALASGVASSADIIQSAEGGRLGFGLRRGAASGRPHACHPDQTRNSPVTEAGAASISNRQIEIPM